MVVSPPEWIFNSGFRPFLIDLLQHAWSAAQIVPFSASSWFRDPVTNERVGGNPFSQHLVGLAFDAVPAMALSASRKPIYSLADLRDALASQGFVAVNEGDHVHAQLWRAGRLKSLIEAVR